MYIYLIYQHFLCLFVLALFVNGEGIWYSYDTYQRLLKSAKFEIFSPSNHPFRSWSIKEISPFLTPMPKTQTTIPKVFSNLVGKKAYKESDKSYMINANLTAFNAMEIYPNCFGNIRNQGKCRANWAFAISSSLSSSFCIKRNETVYLELSPQRLISCGHGSGCFDSDEILGNLLKLYIQNNGITEEKCDPYQLEEGYYINSCKENKCLSNKIEITTYKANITIMTVKEKVLDKRNEMIMENVKKQGSVVGVFGYYDDFIYYKSGIYRNIENSEKLGVIYLKVVKYKGRYMDGGETLKVRIIG